MPATTWQTATHLFLPALQMLVRAKLEWHIITTNEAQVQHGLVKQELYYSISMLLLIEGVYLLAKCTTVVCKCV